MGDPQKVGDPISAHIVYTVHTRVCGIALCKIPSHCAFQTTSPAFSKSSFSVLRRYSDFLWLYETLSANNPGVIVPPVPEKNPFNVSRFEADFVESRRLGLNKCVQKIANHPVLNKDGDFRFFLESDSFALDVGSPLVLGVIPNVLFRSSIAEPKDLKPVAFSALLDPSPDRGSTRLMM